MSFLIIYFQPGLWFIGLLLVSCINGIPTTSNIARTTTQTSLLLANPTTDLTIAIKNSYGTDLSLSFVLGSTSVSGSLIGLPTPLNDPQPTVLPNSASTQYLFPTGWAGNIPIGRDIQVGNSLIEANYVFNEPWIDVSYVDGFSVPITCSSGGNPVTGCNIDLFEQQGVTCDDKVGSVCKNPTPVHNMLYGPPPCFFAASIGAAYTFPFDDNAARPCGTSVSCCIGKSCSAPPRQPVLLPSTCISSSTPIATPLAVPSPMGICDCNEDSCSSSSPACCASGTC